MNKRGPKREDNPEAMSIRAYALACGVDPKNIRKRIKNGGIPPEALVKVGDSFKINKALADSYWALKLETSSKAAIQSPQRPAENLPSIAQPGLKSEKTTEMIDGKPVPVEKIPWMDDMNHLRKAKISTEELKARKMELEVMEMEGTVIGAEEVRETVTKLVSEAKEAILNVPAKIAPDLLACRDVVELETKLLSALNSALNSFSRLEHKYESKD